jgi:hypothetical protein
MLTSLLDKLEGYPRPITIKEDFACKIQAIEESVCPERQRLWQIGELTNFVGELSLLL